jgi:hypothetical protein
MRHTGPLLLGLGTILVALAGCRTQPDLKPPPEPEVLATPGPNDKRYQEPFNYPPEQLASDPVKRSMQGVNQATSGTRPPGGSMGGMGGMPGMGPR